MEHNRQDIILTGPGRSGTTLACYLLNKLPDAVALAEPIPPGKFDLGSPDYEVLVDEVEQYYRRMRKMALRQGVVVSKHVGGRSQPTPRAWSTAYASVWRRRERSRWARNSSPASP